MLRVGVPDCEVLVPRVGSLSVLVISVMEDDILIRCSALKITEEEESIVTLDDARSKDENPNMDLAIVGKVMTLGPYNFEAFKRTMNRIWAISKDALFRTIEHGLFVIKFATLRDKKKVMEGRPWTFD